MFVKTNIDIRSSIVPRWKYECPPGRGCSKSSQFNLGWEYGREGENSSWSRGQPEFRLHGSRHQGLKDTDHHKCSSRSLFGRQGLQQVPSACRSCKTDHGLQCSTRCPSQTPQLWEGIRLCLFPWFHGSLLRQKVRASLELSEALSVLTPSGIIRPVGPVPVSSFRGQVCSTCEPSTQKSQGTPLRLLSSCKGAAGS